MTGKAPNEPPDLFNRIINQVFHRILDVVVIALFSTAVIISMRTGAFEITSAAGAAGMLVLKIFIVIMDKVTEYDLQSLVFLMALFIGPIIALLSSLFRTNETLSAALLAIGSALFGMGAGANLEKSRATKRAG